MSLKELYRDKKGALRSSLLECVNKQVKEHIHDLNVWIKSQTILDDMEEAYFSKAVEHFGDILDDEFYDNDSFITTVRTSGRHLVYMLRALQTTNRLDIEQVLSFSHLLVRQQMDDFDNWAYWLGYHMGVFTKANV